MPRKRKTPVRPENPFKPGDIYEDCAGHPCLCIGAGSEEDPRDIWGISLIDGSYPRSCDVVHCGVEPLTLAQAWQWKLKGPQSDTFEWNISPDKQWWWPKPREGINPGDFLSHLYWSSLNFLRNRLKEVLGRPILGWYEPATFVDSTAAPPLARLEYAVRGEKLNAHVTVEATRDGRQWPVHRITVAVDGEIKPLLFEGNDLQ